MTAISPFNSCRKLLLAAALLFAWYNCAPQGRPGPEASGSEETVSAEPLDILAKDGLKLKATYYSPGKPGPGMLLLHECDMDRKSWHSLALSLSGNGIHVLAFDYRGYGETPSQGSFYEHLPTDIDAALHKLMSQPGVDQNRIAAGGASCGVENAMQLAMRDDTVKALFLLTGPIPQEGADYIKSHPALPVLAIENGDELEAVKALEVIIKNSKNPASRMQACPDGAHGVPIFAKYPEIIGQVTQWLAQVLQ